jgi:hypothetical protein
MIRGQENGEFWQSAGRSLRRLSTIAQKGVSKILETKIDEKGRPAEIVKALPPLEGSDEFKLEYIKEMIQLAQDDARQVLLYVSGSAAVITIVLASLLRTTSTLSTVTKSFMCASVAFIALSSLCFFRYSRYIHLSRMRMIRCIPTLNIVRVRELWAGDAGVWARHRKTYRLGQLLFAIGWCNIFVTLVAALFTRG